MARILLANFMEESGTRLAAFLRIERHEVHMADQAQPLAQMLRLVREFDLVIIDASQREHYVRDLVNHIAKHRAQSGPRPMMLCVCRIYRGPRFELDLEKRGARVIYV